MDLKWWHFILFIILASILIVISAFLIRNFSQSSKQAPQTAKFPCPVPKEFCKTAVIIEDLPSRVGYSVPENTPILSITKGFLHLGAGGGGKYKIPAHPILTVENPDGLSFNYEFFGSTASPSASMVEVKTEIGKAQTPPEVWSNFYKVNLIIKAEKNNKLVPLKSEDFEK